MRVTGFEPATIRLKAEGSTIELHPRLFYLFQGFSIAWF